MRDIEARKIQSRADLERQPAGVDDYLKLWWQEIEESVEQDNVRDLLGYLLVARGALKRKELATIAKNDKLDSFNVGPAITRIDRYLVGGDEAGYRLCHPRFQKYIAEQVVTADDQAPYIERLLAYCAAWKTNDSSYAVRHYARHLLDALARPGAADIGPYADTLASLFSDKDFQAAFMAAAGDLSALEPDMRTALRWAATAADASAARRIFTYAGDLVSARKNWLQPEKIFELADAGDLDAAAAKLGLFDAQPQWRQTALLVIAWIAASKNTAQQSAPARAFLTVHAAEVDRAMLDAPLLLLARVRHALDGGPPPELALPYSPFKLPQPASPETARSIVERLGGQRGVNLSGFESYEETSQYGDETPTYVAERDSPSLVTLLIDKWNLGKPLLQAYIAIHGWNPYREYRNRALWSVLGAVLCDPDVARTIDFARTLVCKALKPGGAEYQEFLFFATLALAAQLGDAGARAEFDERRQRAVDKAGGLETERSRADSWGHHCRRLTALAEAYAVGLNDHAAAEVLLVHARKLPVGYAGFQALASLALAEANRVCIPMAVEAITAALKASRRSAHNVQEPPFCAAITARVNAMQRRWWQGNGTLLGLPAVIERFVQAPEAAEFAAVHIVGEDFGERAEKQQKLRIPPEILECDDSRRHCAPYLPAPGCRAGQPQSGRGSGARSCRRHGSESARSILRACAGGSLRCRDARAASLPGRAAMRDAHPQARAHCDCKPDGTRLRACPPSARPAERGSRRARIRTCRCA